MTGFAIGFILFILIVLAMSGFFDVLEELFKLIGALFSFLFYVLKLLFLLLIVSPITLLIGYFIEPRLNAQNKAKLHAFYDKVFAIVDINEVDEQHCEEWQEFQEFQEWKRFKEKNNKN